MMEPGRAIKRKHEREANEDERLEERLFLIPAAG
jgi:hypothetical protein